MTTSPTHTDTDFKIQLSGHETFPLRQLWIPKLTRYINEARMNDEVPTLNVNKAIVQLGVGKNMVGAIRFWADAADIVDSSTLSLTELGRLILGDGNKHGLDESCSSLTTQWLVHWRLAATPERFTPIWFLFNKVTSPTLDREAFFASLTDFCTSMNVKTSTATIKRAVDVCLRSYLPKLSGKGHAEDFIEPLLAELDLLDTKSRDVFAFRRSAHPTLSDELFAFAIMEYWQRLPYDTSSLDFARIAHDIGSPGKVFKLDAESVTERLYRLSELTGEALVWTEQAGLRQLVRRGKALTAPDRFKYDLLRQAYA